MGGVRLKEKRKLHPLAKCIHVPSRHMCAINLRSHAAWKHIPSPSGFLSHMECTRICSLLLFCCPTFFLFCFVFLFLPFFPPFCPSSVTFDLISWQYFYGVLPRLYSCTFPVCLSSPFLTGNWLNASEGPPVCTWAQLQLAVVLNSMWLSW